MAITKVTGNVIAINAMAGLLIADNAITAVHIATNAVTALQIVDGATASALRISARGGIVSCPTINSTLVVVARSGNISVGVT